MIRKILTESFGNNEIYTDGFRKYLHNTFWLFLDKFIRLLMALCIGIWMIRYLGPGQFGILSYAISFVGLFSALATLGIDNVLVRDLAAKPQKECLILGTAFGLKLCGAMISICLVWVASGMLSGDSSSRLIIMIVALSSLTQSLCVIEFYFRAHVLSKYILSAGVTAVVIGSIIRILLILNRFPLQFFAAVIALEFAISGISFIFFYRSCGRPVRKWRFDFGLARRLLSDGWPLLFAGIMVSIYMKIDQIMIKSMLGEYAVGQYAAAVKLSEVWYFIPMVICQSVLPSIVNSRSFDNKLYAGRMQRLYNLMVLTSIAIALPVSLTSDYLIPLAYGDSFMAASPVLKLHIWATVFVSLGIAGSNWLLVENMQKYYMINTSAGALINIVANVFLIRAFSIKGAALATVLSYFFSAYLGLFFFRQTRPCFFDLSRALVFWGCFNPKDRSTDEKKDF